MLEDDIFCDGIYYSVSFWLSLVSGVLGARSAIRPTNTHTQTQTYTPTHTIWMDNGNGFGKPRHRRNEGAVVPASYPYLVLWPLPYLQAIVPAYHTLVYIPNNTHIMAKTQFIPIELEVEIVYRSILCAGLLSSSKSKTRSLSALLFIIINKLFVYENNKYKQKARHRIRAESTRWCGPIVNGNWMINWNDFVNCVMKRG